MRPAIIYDKIFMIYLHEPSLEKIHGEAEAWYGAEKFPGAESAAWISHYDIKHQPPSEKESS